MVNYAVHVYVDNSLSWGKVCSYKISPGYSKSAVVLFKPLCFVVHVHVTVYSLRSERGSQCMNIEFHNLNKMPSVIIIMFISTIFQKLDY